MYSTVDGSVGVGENNVRTLSSATPPQSRKSMQVVLARARTGIDIACGEGALRIERLQLAGSRPQSVADLINGGKALLLPGQELH